MKKKLLTALLLLMIPILVSCTVEKVDEKEIDEKDDVVIDNTVEVPEPVVETETISLTLYFPDNDALYLHPEVREVEIHKDELLAPVVLEELFKGPESDELSPCLDGEKLVNSVSVSEGLCTVDFHEDFAILNSGGSTRESFAIGAIVNSLCELEGIDEVKINIGGNPDAVFGGHFTLESPFAPQTDLISK